MNCFSHGFLYLHDPYFLVGTALPDWLTLLDRKVRVREKRAREFQSDSSREANSVAQGIVQHHIDDHWFHNHRPFVELNLRLAIDLRNQLGQDAGFRPHFVAHVVIEMLLDACLASRDRSKLDRYYECVASVDARLIQDVVNQIATVPTYRVVEFIPLFCSEKYLYDYFEDAGILYRMNRILKRVKLAELPESCLDWTARAREQVYNETEFVLEPLLTKVKT